MNMKIGDVSSKMQQITCKSEMSVPNCKNTNNKQKQQRIQKNIPCIEKCNQKLQDTNQKPKEPETRNEPKTKKPEPKTSQIKNKNTLPFLSILTFTCYLTLCLPFFPISYPDTQPSPRGGFSTGLQSVVYNRLVGVSKTISSM